NKSRLGTVESCNAPKTLNDVRHVRAKNSTVGVHLVENDVAKSLKEGGPLGVIGKDPRVEHVGVAQDNAPLFTGLSACVAGAVAIEGNGRKGQSTLLDQLVEAVLLITWKRLSRIKEESGGAGVSGQSLQHR